MFTGIVREIGVVEEARHLAGGLELSIHAAELAPRIGFGDSVALDGVCLTAEGVEGGLLRFHAVPETLARTTLAELEPGGRVNLEPAVCVGEPLGGHLVLGHVDGTGTVTSIGREGAGARLAIELPHSLLRYCIEKGSITLAGVGLTVAAVRDTGLEVALVPQTLERTTLGALSPGRRVNVEVDVIAKYVERLLGTMQP